MFIYRHDFVGGIRYTRGRIAAGGLQQQLRRLYFGQLLQYQFLVTQIRSDEDMLHRNYFAESVERHLQQRSASAKQVKKLLGAFGGAERPETAANSSCHNHAKIIVFHIFGNCELLDSILRK
jgi:hypothetical protein